LADRGHQVDDAGGDRVRLGLQAQALLRVQRRELVEVLAVLGVVRAHAVDGVQADQRVVLLATLLAAASAVALSPASAGLDGADDGVAAAQPVLAHLRHRDVDVVRSGQVAGGADERVVVEDVEDAGDGHELLVVLPAALEVVGAAVVARAAAVGAVAALAAAVALALVVALAAVVPLLALVVALVPVVAAALAAALGGGGLLFGAALVLLGPLAADAAASDRTVLIGLGRGRGVLGALAVVLSGRLLLPTARLRRSRRARGTAGAAALGLGLLGGAVLGGLGGGRRGLGGGRRGLGGRCSFRVRHWRGLLFRAGTAGLRTVRLLRLD